MNVSKYFGKWFAFIVKPSSAAFTHVILYQLNFKTPFSSQKDGVCFYHTPKLTAYDCL
jgi:hypothetical protein